MYVLVKFIGDYEDECSSVGMNLMLKEDWESEVEIFKNAVSYLKLYFNHDGSWAKVDKSFIDCYTAVDIDIDQLKFIKNKIFNGANTFGFFIYPSELVKPIEDHNVYSFAIDIDGQMVSGIVLANVDTLKRWTSTTKSFLDQDTGKHIKLSPKKENFIKVEMTDDIITLVQESKSLTIQGPDLHKLMK